MIMMIRKARLKDVPAIVNMWKEFMKEHDRIVVDGNPVLKEHVAKKDMPERLFRDYVRKNIRSKNSIIFIADDNGRPIGYNMNHIRANIPVFRIERLGLIGDLFVKKEYRGTKIASMFKDHAFRWFKGKGLKYAVIEVSEPNSHAHSVYRKWGFADHRIEMRKKI